MTTSRRESISQSVGQSNKAASTTKASQSSIDVRMPLMMKPHALKVGVMNCQYATSMLFVLNRQP